MEIKNNLLYNTEKNEVNFKEKNDSNNNNLLELENNIISNDASLKKEKKHKGYVRILRNYIKKKEKIRKDIIQNLFKRWMKQTLKGAIIKKKIMIRISLSKEKEPKNKYRDKYKMEKENIKEQSKSVNKKIIKSINKYPSNSKKEKLKNNLTIIPKEKINIKINNTNLNNYDIAKRIKNYQGPNNKIQNINKTNYTIKKPENNKIIDISNEKSKITPKINISDKSKNIYPINNLNTQFLEITYSSKKNNNKIINNNKSNNYIKIEPQNIKNIINTNKKDINSNSNTKLICNNNSSIAFTSSFIKNSSKNIEKIQKDDYKIRYNTNSANTGQIKKEGNINFIKLNVPIYNNSKRNDLNNKKGNANKTYIPYDKNKIKIYKKEISNNNINKTYNIDKNYNRTNIHKNITKKINNNNCNKNKEGNIGERKSYYSSRRNSNSAISQLSQLTEKSSLKGGVTTVIQHYSGKRRQYEQYDNNSQKK